MTSFLCGKHDKARLKLKKLDAGDEHSSQSPRQAGNWNGGW